MPKDAKGRILDVAMREFAIHGFGGARVDRIAAKSRTNKQLTYYYFGSKKALYDEVLHSAYAEVVAAEKLVPENLEDDLLYWMEFHLRHPYLLRLLEWHGRTKSGRNGETDPTQLWRNSLERLGRNGKGTSWPSGFQGAHALIACIALVSWPVEFPHICRQISGLDPEAPEFLNSRRRFIRDFVRALTVGSKR